MTSSNYFECRDSKHFVEDAETYVKHIGGWMAKICADECRAEILIQTYKKKIQTVRDTITGTQKFQTKGYSEDLAGIDSVFGNLATEADKLYQEF